MQKYISTKKDLVYGTIYSHAPCLIKAEAIEAVKGYSVGKKLLRVEGWNLWIKIYASGRYGKNLSESLYKIKCEMIRWLPKGENLNLD